MEIEYEIKKLIRNRDTLINELKLLKKKYECGEISREEYENKRRVIEREIVEVMDRLVQYKFISENF